MILEYIADILMFEFCADIIYKKSYLLKVVINNWIVLSVVLLLNGKNNCEHKLEHVMNQLWILVNWK